MTTDIHCNFCGSEPSDDRDDCYVYDEKSGACICICCLRDCLTSVYPWVAGKLEYDSWPKVSLTQHETI